jgi:hypothetical protein
MSYGIWITSADGANGRWMTNLIQDPWTGTFRDAVAIIDDKREYADQHEPRYEVREYDLAETHEEVKRLRDRNAVLEKIAAAVVHYREMCRRPGLYSDVQRNGKLAIARPAAARV